MSSRGVSGAESGRWAGGAGDAAGRAGRVLPLQGHARLLLLLLFALLRVHSDHGDASPLLSSPLLSAPLLSSPLLLSALLCSALCSAPLLCSSFCVACLIVLFAARRARSLAHPHTCTRLQMHGTSCAHTNARHAQSLFLSFNLRWPVVISNFFNFTSFFSFNIRILGLEWCGGAGLELALGSRGRRAEASME